MKLVSFLAVCLLATGLVTAEVQVSGTVSNSVGKPLADVSIVQKGTHTETTTNISGEYKMSVDSSSAILVFSRSGYVKQEVSLAGQTQLNVTLKDNVIELGKMQVVGSRSFKRTATETPAPVDVIDVKEVMDHSGQVNINQLLQYSAPSFNCNKQSGSDGSDHIDPATLRGLGPDQTLVLINGKRRHQSSLINIFGTRGRGNTGTDLDAIPAASIERIEILRDGASAQYGSDAIAGVINIVLKSSVKEFTGSVTGGAQNATPSSDYHVKSNGMLDGETFNGNANYGVPIGEAGFANFSLDFINKNKTNRTQDTAKYPDVYREKYGDASATNIAGYVNSSIPITENFNGYVFGGYNHRYTNAYAWTRLRGRDDNRIDSTIYPNGFNPEIASNIQDYSVSAGLRTKMNEWNIDLNNTIGNNKFNFIIEHTLNASLKEKSPTKFDAGGFQLLQNTTDIDFSKYYSEILHGSNLAFGAAYRIDDYIIFAGEVGSYKNGGKQFFFLDTAGKLDSVTRPAGSQGFPGFQPSNAVDKSRTNTGVYLDADIDVLENLTVGAAVRYENYSDFGNTINGKLATQYKIAPVGLTIRGTVGTGFRAPSLAQSYFNSSFTDFVAGIPTEKLIARNDSPLADSLGIPRLKEERAINMNLGLTEKISDFTATVDVYRVLIKDRIVMTGAFEDSDTLLSLAVRNLLLANKVAAVQFFSNAIDTKTDGLDIVLGYSKHMDIGRINATVAANFTNMSFDNIKTSAKLKGREDVYFGEREQLFLLASAPENKINLSLNYKLKAMDVDLQLTRFGEVRLKNWNDRGDTTLTEREQIDVYKPKIVTSLTLGYDISKNIFIYAGSNNLFNVYPDDHDPGLTESGGIWDAVQMGSGGALYFTKLAVKF